MFTGVLSDYPILSFKYIFPVMTHHVKSEFGTSDQTQHKKITYVRENIHINIFLLLGENRVIQSK